MKHTIFSHRLRWWLPSRTHTAWPSASLSASEGTPPLQLLAQQPPAQWPECVRRSALATKYIRLLGALDWRQLPPRPGGRAWPGPAPAAVTPYLIALLIRVDQQLPTMGALVRLLHQQPELAWLAGFPPTTQPYQGVPPTTTSLSQVLRRLPNAVLQALLHQTVHLLARNLPSEPPFGETVVFDTKHILAWVKENNPKTYIRTGRFDKTQQPKGDPDCKLGCKRRHNQTTTPAAPPPTPKAEGQRPPRQGVGTGEFYWGYASGIVVTKAPLWGEFVLAELTQTFDQSDVSYFAPLMAQVERRLGRRPRFGAGDAAFDAHYIYMTTSTKRAAERCTDSPFWRLTVTASCRCAVAPSRRPAVQ
ncbi:MAG: hypothetical protein IPK16_33220 [Anaerolineales bacterium]|nr:hypothetical protein [Anaerolineales bacterium]